MAAIVSLFGDCFCIVFRTSFPVPQKEGNYHQVSTKLAIGEGVNDGREDGPVLKLIHEKRGKYGIRGTLLVHRNSD